jgi:hypothetical protein
MSTTIPYGALLNDLGRGIHHFATDTYKFALLGSGYSFDIDNHKVFSDVSASEITGVGYTQGGTALSNITYTYQNGNDRSVLTADPVLWPELTANIRYCVLYQVGSDDANSPLVGVVDFGQERGYNGEPFQLSFPNGVITVSGS